MALTGRRRRGLEAALGLGLLAALVVLLNTVAGQHPVRFDLTRDARYTLAPETRALLAELRSPLEIRVFLPSQAPAPWSDAVRALADLLDGVRLEGGGRVRVFAHDSSDPEQATEAPGLGLAPVELGVRGREGGAFFGAVLLYEDEKAVLTGTPVVADLEFEFARALRDVLRPEARRPVVLFSQGHGEPDVVASPLAARLRASGDLENVDLQGDLLPGRGDALVILGPSRPFDARARYVVDQFLMDGKTVVALLDYRPRSTVFPDLLVPTETGLEPLLAHLGLPVESQWTVLDRARAQPTPITQGADGRMVVGVHPLYVQTGALAPGHPVTRGLRGLVVPVGAPIRPTGAAEVLVASEATAVARRDLRAFDPAGLRMPPSEAGLEQPGPFVLGAVVQGVFTSLFAGHEIPARAERPPGAPPAPPSAADPPMIAQGRGAGRLLVVTSGRRLLAAGEDAQVFLANAVDWAVTASDLAGLRARAATDPPLRPLTSSEQSGLRNANVLGPPLLLLLVGLVRAALVRRRRR